MFLNLTKILLSRYVARESSLEVLNPKLLLLKGSIVFDKYRDKFESLSDTASEEEECVRNLCRKIAESGANVVMVEKEIAAGGRDTLTQKGIQVKECVLS